MDQFPESKLSKNLDALNPEEIRKLYSFCPEDKKIQFLENLRESNISLERKLNEGIEEIDNLKELNRLLLIKTWEFIDSEYKKEAAPFFENLSKIFE